MDDFTYNLSHIDAYKMLGKWIHLHANITRLVVIFELSINIPKNRESQEIKCCFINLGYGLRFIEVVHIFMIKI